VEVAIVELTPGIADAYYRAAIEDASIEALRTEPSATREVVIFVALPPILAPESSLRHEPIL
jgi:hypothetical protein